MGLKMSYEEFVAEMCDDLFERPQVVDVMEEEGSMESHIEDMLDDLEHERDFYGY